MILLAAGCAQEERPHGEGSSQTVSLEGLPDWTIADSPLVTVGGADAPPEEEFLLATRAFLNDNGDLVVIDEGTRRLIFFDAAGTFLRRVGGQGDGPGEYRAASWVPVARR